MGHLPQAAQLPLQVAGVQKPTISSKNRLDVSRRWTTAKSGNIKVPSVSTGSGSRTRSQFRCGTLEIARETFFQPAVVGLRLRARRERIARPQMYCYGLAAQHALRGQIEAFTPGEQGKDRCERPSIHRRMAEQ